MRLYELVVVIRSSLSEGERKKVVTALKDMLKHVKVTKEDEWGQKPLAYKIKHELAGVYHLFHIEAENGLGIELEKKITRSDGIIRHLLVRTK